MNVAEVNSVNANYAAVITASIKVQSISEILRCSCDDSNSYFHFVMVGIAWLSLLACAIRIQISME